MNDGYPSNPPPTRAGLLARLTGAATLATGALLYGGGTSQLQTLAPGASGQLLRTNAAAAPSWANIADGVTGGVATFAGTLTGARTYTLPNASTTIAGLSVSQTFTVTQTFDRTTSGAAILINRASDAVQSDFTFSTGNLNRWIWRNVDAEPGANAGGNLYLIRRDDAGAFVANTLVFLRSSGQVCFEFGTAALPTITFSTDNDTGLFRLGSNILGVTCGGVNTMQIYGGGITANVGLSDTVTASPELRMARGRVTGTGGQVLSGDRLGIIRWQGNDDSGTVVSASSIRSDAAEIWTTTARGCSLTFAVVPLGATGANDRMRLHGDGGLQIGTVNTTSPGTGVTSTSVALIVGTTTRVASEACRIAGGTMAAAGATDVIFAAGAGALGSATDSTTTTTGALTVAGGVGIVKSLWVGATVNCVGLSATGVATLGSTSTAGHVFIGNTAHTLRDQTAQTAAVDDVLTLQTRSSGTAAAGFGQRVLAQLASSTGADRTAFDVTTSWVVATDASRTARTVLSVYDTAARECIRMQASGTAAQLGFYGAAAVAKPTCTGSRGGNAALASALSALASLGLITDSTTA